MMTVPLEEADFKLENVPHVVSACVVLYNMCEMYGDNWLTEWTDHTPQTSLFQSLHPPLAQLHVMVQVLFVTLSCNNYPAHNHNFPLLHFIITVIVTKVVKK